MTSEIGVLVDAAMAQQPYRGKDGFVATVEALEAFEARLGHKMPPDFRYFQLNVPDAIFSDRVSPYSGPLRATHVPYFGLGIEMMYDTDLERLYRHDDLPASWDQWLAQLVPCATDGDNNYLCLDFAFDGENPPVVVIEYDRGGNRHISGLSDQQVRFVADSFLEMLGFEIVDEETGTYQTRDNRVSQRMVDWETHRNKILSPHAKPEFVLNASDINWPT